MSTYIPNSIYNLKLTNRFSVTIVSVVRLWSLVHVNLEDPDVTWNAVDAALWTIVEVNISILCCMCPSMRALGCVS